MAKRYTSLVGEKFNRLTVIEEVGKNHYGIIYKCRCECGTEKEFTAVRLRTKNVQSCGCLRRDHFRKHSLSETRPYKIFQGMKKRCYNLNEPNYKDYGAREITICNEWLNDVQTFYDWAMNNGYKDGLSIERLDFNGNYEPKNCTWIELKKQGRNRRNAHSIEHEGETYTIRELAAKYDMNEHTLAYRIRTGWKLEDAINIPASLDNSWVTGKRNDRDDKGRFK